MHFMVILVHFFRIIKTGNLPYSQFLYIVHQGDHNIRILITGQVDPEEGLQGRYHIHETIMYCMN